jgi:uncharacterized membrane protein YkoI
MFSAKNIALFAAAIFIMVFSIAATPPQEKEAREKEQRAKEERELIEGWRTASQEQGNIDLKVRREKEQREVDEANKSMSPEEREAAVKAKVKMIARRQAELAKMAKITMEQAIQIAGGQKAGTAMECSLIGERGTAFYRVTIVSGDENDPTLSHVFVNAVDGTIGDFPNAGYAVIVNGKSMVFSTSEKP